MKVLRVCVYRYDLPLARPLVLQGCRVESRSGLVLRLEGENDAVAWGEASPLPGFSSESLQQVTDSAVQLPRALEGRLLHPLFGGITDRIRRWMGGFAAPPSLQFAIDAALLSLLAQARGVALCRLLSKHPLTRVPLNGLLAGTLDEIADEAAELRAAGYRAVKLKVGRRPVSEDIETVRTVREILGDEIALRLDANRAWDHDTAVRFARGIEGCGVEYIEEPLDDPSHLVDFSGRTGLPVALDETVVEVGARSLETWRGAKAAILKPTLLGGIEAAFWLARRACNAGMTPVFTSTFETGLGLVTLAHVAAAFYDSEVPVGLATRDWFRLDLLDGELPIAEGQFDMAELEGRCGAVRPECLQDVGYV
jgi:O-succinylbenzoate synthase